MRLHEPPLPQAKSFHYASLRDFFEALNEASQLGTVRVSIGILIFLSRLSYTARDVLPLELPGVSLLQGDVMTVSDFWIPYTVCLRYLNDVILQWSNLMFIVQSELV